MSPLKKKRQPGRSLPSPSTPRRTTRSMTTTTTEDKDPEPEKAPEAAHEEASEAEAGSDSDGEMFCVDTNPADADDGESEAQSDAEPAESGDDDDEDKNDAASSDEGLFCIDTAPAAEEAGQAASDDDGAGSDDDAASGDDQLFCIDSAPGGMEPAKAAKSARQPASKRARKSQAKLRKQKRKQKQQSEAKADKPGASIVTADQERQLEKFLFGGDLQRGVGTTAGDAPSSSSSSSEDDTSSDESGDDDEKAPAKAPVKSPKKAPSASDTKTTTTIPEDTWGKALWGEGEKKAKKRKAAWKDEDDDDIRVKDVTATYAKAKGKHGLKETSDEKYSKALKRKFVSLMGTPKWADLDREKKLGPQDKEDSDDEFFQETTDMLSKAQPTSQLGKNTLDYRKLKDLNSSTHTEGAILRSTEFHPSARVALAAGSNGVCSLFQVDGQTNPKMQSVQLENFPVRTAHFTRDGRQFVAGSKHHGHWHVYDMYAGKGSRVDMARQLGAKGQSEVSRFEMSPAGDLIAVLGRFGQISLVTADSKERAFGLKMNDDVEAAAFSPGGDKLYSHGAGGEVFVWDLRQSKSCLRRFHDDGCVRGTALAVSPDHRLLAAGADSGVVNLYDVHALLNGQSSTPTPTKIVLNLTTSVAELKFNPTSEILAMSSELKDNALKLLHVPSGSVFQNFPSWSFNLKRVNCVDFSLNGGYMSVGNNRGAANLYRLNHYGSY